MAPLKCLVVGAVGVALQGRHVTAGAAVQTWAADQPDTCQAGSACSPMVSIDKYHGLCVGGDQCWDACNPNHDIHDYAPSFPAGPEKKAIAMMIKQMRTGNHFQACADFQNVHAKDNNPEGICDPDQRCTPPGLTFGRGMCITLQGTGKGNECLDMCDTSIPKESWKQAAGAQAGIWTIVQKVQNGRDPAGLTTCPGVTVWVWLWFPLLLCCSIGFCAGGFYWYKFIKRANKRGANKGYTEPDYVEDQQQPFVDYGEGMPQPDYQQDMEMPAPQDDPMPVVEPEPMPVVQPIAEQPQAQMDLFGQPALAPSTIQVAAPVSSSYMMGPTTGSQYVTSYAAPATTAYAAPTTYPAASSMVINGGQVYSQPAYTTTSMSVANPIMTTQLPAQYTQYPATGALAATSSMRIG